MKTSGDRKWLVYMHTSPSGKHYIGVTSRTMQERAQNGAGYAKCPYMHRAIEKYGWDNFTHEILEQDIDGEDIDARQQYWIKKYNSNDKNYGYNLTSGGQVNRILNPESIRKSVEKHIGRKKSKQEIQKWIEAVQKAVVQLMKDGTFIARYPSIKDAKAGIGHPNADISDCAQGKIRTVAGYIWMYEEDYQDPQKVAERIEFAQYSPYKDIWQLDVKGNIVNHYQSPIFADEDGYNRYAIVRSARDVVNVSYGYIWVYSEHIDDKEYIKNRVKKAQAQIQKKKNAQEKREQQKMKPKKKRMGGNSEKIARPIVQLTFEGIPVAQYKTTNGAATKYHKRNTGFANCAKGKLHSYLGYIWMYAEDAEDENKVKQRIEEYRKSLYSPSVAQLTFDGDIVAIYESVSYVLNKFGYEQASISRCLAGKNASSYGYIWMYENQANNPDKVKMRVEQAQKHGRRKSLCKHGGDKLHQRSDDTQAMPQVHNAIM